MRLRVLKDTVLKTRTCQSCYLLPEDKVNLKADKLRDMSLHSYRAEDSHYRVAFAEASFRGSNTWYVYCRHVQLVRYRQETE